jgi:hypothetical protein
MKRCLIFSVSLLFCLQLQAQWNVYDSGKEYQVLVSTAQGQTAIYKNTPCEVKLVSLKNKILKLTSSNATVTPNAEPGSYSIQTSDENAVLQIYSAKKSKMKLLKEIQIRTVDVPLLDELTLSGNSLSVGYSYNMQFASGYDPSPYDQQVFSKYYSVESWAFSCPAARKNLYGSGNQLSQEVTSFLRYLPEGVSYEIIAYHNGPINPGDYQPNVMQAFTSQNTEMPGAKYVVLNNTPANKAFFDPNDPNSLIGLVNNNYFSFKDPGAGIISEFKGKIKDETFGFESSGFIGSDYITSGISDMAIKNRFKNKIPSGFGCSYTVSGIQEKTNGMDEMGNVLSVYVKKGAPYDSIKGYIKYGNRYDVETFDPATETMNQTDAEKDSFGSPRVQTYFVQEFNPIYSTDNISQIVIRYDSLFNLLTGMVEIVPSRFSFGRKLGISDTLDIVFSMKIKDLLYLNQKTYNNVFFAPTTHIKNDKTNASLFDAENPNSLVSIIKQNNWATFPYLNESSLNYFAEYCDPKGKKDEKSIFRTEDIAGPFEKTSGMDAEGNPFPVYVRKGFSTEIKIWDRYEMEAFNSINETMNPKEAELIPGTMNPCPVIYKTRQINYSQYKGITDLYIINQFVTDPVFGITVSKPTHLGFTQQMPGQSKPTLIIETPVYADLLSKLPKIQSNILINQPWVQAILMNDVDKQGEVIEATDVKKLQKKFHFLRQIKDINTMEMEYTDVPHF